MKEADCVEFYPAEKRAVLLKNFSRVEEIKNVERVLVIDTVVSHVDISDDRAEVLLKGPMKWNFDGETLRIGSSRWLKCGLLPTSVRSFPLHRRNLPRNHR